METFVSNLVHNFQVNKVDKLELDFQESMLIQGSENEDFEMTMMNESYENDTINNNNSTNTIPELPIDMIFNDGHKLSIIVYSFLFVIGSVGNISVIVAIYKYRRRPKISRVNLLLLHLAVADLFVTFLLMPMEIAWASTVSWIAGDLACRGLSFFRTFGLYLSGFIMVCISVDRYFAVVKPLAICEANHRGRNMVCAAWTGSILCSFPQIIIFHVEKHPNFPWYEQCVTFNAFASYPLELTYYILGFIGMYGFPLVTIIFCYGAILCEITKITKIFVDGEEIRRSNIARMGKAKMRTLKMTILIVVTFFLCWTPYNIMSIWYWIDRESASKVDQRIQKGFFLFAVTNSCFNPLVYGLFNIRRHRPNVPLPVSQRQPQTFNLLNNQNHQRQVSHEPRQFLNNGQIQTPNNKIIRGLERVCIHQIPFQQDSSTSELLRSKSEETNHNHLNNSTHTQNYQYQYLSYSLPSLVLIDEVKRNDMYKDNLETMKNNSLVDLKRISKNSKNFITHEHVTNNISEAQINPIPPSKEKTLTDFHSTPDILYSNQTFTDFHSNPDLLYKNKTLVFCTSKS